MIYIGCLVIGFVGGFGCAWAWLKKTNAKGVLNQVAEQAKTEVRDAAGNIVK